MNFAGTLQRIRLPLGFLLAVLYLAFARPRPLTFVVGVTVAFVGLLLRGWAAGHIVKTTRLTTSGPYAHTRNPLYFGSFLIAAGFAIAAHWTVLLLVIAFWVLVYWPVIERERVGISGAFPDTYPEYERNVPAFVPRLRPWRQGVSGTATRTGSAPATGAGSTAALGTEPATAAGTGSATGTGTGSSVAAPREVGGTPAESGRFDFGLYMRHREWQAALGFAVAAAWLAYRTRWYM